MISKLLTVTVLLAVLGACRAADDPPDARDPQLGDAVPRDTVPARTAGADTAPLPADTVPADTLPYRIDAPRAGVLWREGETHVIRWTRAYPGPVNVGAAVGGKDKGHLSFAIPAGTDSLEWRIPVGFVTGFGPERSDAVRIRVESSDDPRIGVESAPFTIAAADTATSPIPP